MSNKERKEWKKMLTARKKNHCDHFQRPERGECKCISVCSSWVTPQSPVYSSRHSALAHTYFDGVVHLGGHEFAGRHDDILALLAGKVTVDIPGVFEQVCGIALQKLHLLQRLLKLLRFLDHLERVQQNTYSVKIEFCFVSLKYHYTMQTAVRSIHTVLYFSSWLLLVGME